MVWIKKEAILRIHVTKWTSWGRYKRLTLAVLTSMWLPISLPISSNMFRYQHHITLLWPFLVASFIWGGLFFRSGFNCVGTSGRVRLTRQEAKGFHFKPKANVSNVDPWTLYVYVFSRACQRLSHEPKDCEERCGRGYPKEEEAQQTLCK